MRVENTRWPWIPLLGVFLASSALAEDMQGPVPLPDQIVLPNVEAEKVARGDLLRMATFDSYHEPQWVSAKVAAGEFPPVRTDFPPFRW